MDRREEGQAGLSPAQRTNLPMFKIAFTPEWPRDGKAAPFKRNDRMLEIVPIGLIVFPGLGITGNLADKTIKLRIPVSTTETTAHSAGFLTEQIRKTALLTGSKRAADCQSCLPR